jgi:protein SCO1/2
MRVNIVTAYYARAAEDPSPPPPPLTRTTERIQTMERFPVYTQERQISRWEPNARMDSRRALDQAPSSTSVHRSGRRRIWIWILIGAVVAAGAAAAAVIARVSTPALQGAVVTPPMPTYDFTLRDERDRQVRLSDFRGKAVALTFLYTHCPDACPLTAQKLHQTRGQLGDLTSRVAFLAVSVDPAGDTPEAIRTFLATHQVEGELSYLTGSFADLRRVWGYFLVTSDAKDPSATEKGPAGAAGSPASLALVGHSSIVHVIDPSGNLRVFLPGNFDPKDLVTDLRILIAEKHR